MQFNCDGAMAALVGSFQNFIMRKTHVTFYSTFTKLRHLLEAAWVTMGKKLIDINYRWPYFHNAVKSMLETVCTNWERQCAKRKLLDALRRCVCGITKCNVIEICFPTVNGVIRIKIDHVFGMITSYW